MATGISIEREALAVVINLARGWQCARASYPGVETEDAVRIQHDQFDGSVVSFWYPHAGIWMGDVRENGKLVKTLGSPANEKAGLSIIATEILEAVEAAAWHQSWSRELQLVIRMDAGKVIAVDGLPYGARYEVVDERFDSTENDATQAELMDDDAQESAIFGLRGADRMPVALRQSTC